MITGLDLISIFDDILKENKLTKKVIVKTKRNKIFLFGRYNKSLVSMKENAFQMLIYEKDENFRESSFDSDQAIKDAFLTEETDLILSISQLNDQTQNELDIFVYKKESSNCFSKYNFIKKDEPFCLNIKVKEGTIILRHKDIEEQY